MSERVTQEEKDAIAGEFGGGGIAAPRVFQRQTHVGTAWTFQDAPGGRMWGKESDARRAASEYAQAMRQKWGDQA